MHAGSRQAESLNRGVRPIKLPRPATGIVAINAIRRGGFPHGYV